MGVTCDVKYLFFNLDKLINIENESNKENRQQIEIKKQYYASGYVAYKLLKEINNLKFCATNSFIFYAKRFYLFVIQEISSIDKNSNFTITEKFINLFKIFV